MRAVPPPLPARRAAAPPPLPKSGCQNGCVMMLVGGVCVFGLFILVLGTWGSKIGTEAEAAKARLAERLEKVGQRNEAAAEAPQSDSDAAAAPANIIPGMAPVDVYLNLEEKGFTTKKDFGASQNTFVCQLEADECSYTVTAYTPAGSASTVKTVQVMAQWFGPDDNAATEKLKPFMGFAATFPYKGATPEEARRWVETHLGTETSKVFGGGVKFELFSKARTRLLRISMDPSNSTLLPSKGQTYAEVIAKFGEPSAKAQDTGWALWPTFRARFVAGTVSEVVQSDSH